MIGSERIRAQAEYVLEGKAFPDITDIKKRELSIIPRFLYDNFDVTIECFRDVLPDKKKVYATHLRLGLCEMVDSVYENKGLLLIAVGVGTLALSVFFCTQASSLHSWAQH